MPDIIIRDLISENKHAALNILYACYPDEPGLYQEFEERFAAHLAPQKGAYVVRFVGAFENEILVGIGGYAESSITDDCWELSWGTVLPDKQGQGIGKAILDFRLERILIEAKKEEAFALISTKPTSLYLDKGFQVLFKTERNGGGILYKKLR
jgi:GNAT superfamily N-acetyltransferase